MVWINPSLRCIVELKISYSPNRVGNTATVEIHGKPSRVPVVVKSCGKSMALHKACSAKAGGK